jgi:hypothetical protein
LYILLTGTKKNAGDFLIVHSARRLIERFAPVSDCCELPAWLPVDDKLETINSAKALILCGGPAIQHGLGTRIYPIIPVLDRIKVPIVAFGLGWKASPGDAYDMEHFTLPSLARPLLDRLANDFPYAGCRDVLTCRILQRHGCENATMTGCPSWYDPDFMETAFEPVSAPSKILFTPAEHPMFRAQSMAVMETVCSLFPQAQIVCSFHRGWTADAYTPTKNADNARLLKERAETLGMEVLDVSGSVEGMLGYDRFDLHIGYRVHAHLKMLSMRKPSVLLCEDGRARGALESMGLEGIDGWNDRLGRLWFPHPFVRRVTRTLLATQFADSKTPDKLVQLIKWHMENQFEEYRKADQGIRATWPTMEKMLQSLPG